MKMNRGDGVICGRGGYGVGLGRGGMGRGGMGRGGRG